MKTAHRLSIGVMLTAILSSSAPAGVCPVEVCIRFDPPDTTVDLSDVFTIDIVADLNTPIVGWGIDLTIDTPAIVSLSAVPAIPAPWLAAFAPDGDMLAALADPFEPVNGSVDGFDITLATLTFTADNAGETDLLLSYTLADPTEGFAKDPTGFAEVFFETGHITVIPEPATAALFACLLAFLIACRPRGLMRSGKIRNGLTHATPNCCVNDRGSGVTTLLHKSKKGGCLGPVHPSG